MPDGTFKATAFQKREKKVQLVGPEIIPMMFDNAIIVLIEL